MPSILTSRHAAHPDSGRVHAVPSEITPQAVYASRRQWLREAALLGGGVLTSALPLTGAQAQSGPAASATVTRPGKRAALPAVRSSVPGALALDKLTSYEHITTYNNFYEFGTDKDDPKRAANRGWKTEPWTLEFAGEIANPGRWDVNDLIGRLGGIEQRVYRHRCVEAWSMVIPWDGFALAKLVAFAAPTSAAKFLRFVTFNDPKQAPGQREPILDWPYVEGLRLDEATNELAFLATGMYGKPIPNQNGAPIRLVVPWKYGFKGIKSIVRIEFTTRQPMNTWQRMAPNEYGFYANVNPQVDHPRWSQASERVIGGGFFSGKQPTLMFNGYEKQVAGLYADLDLRRNF